MMKRITIIIISYNEINYIREAVNSCLEQDLLKKNIEYEIIIADDGSDDGSIEVIRELQNRYSDIIKYLVMNRENMEYLIPSIRASNAIKSALNISSGEYIQVMSADDLLCCKYKLSESIQFLDNNINYTSCYTDYKMFWNDGTEKTIDYKKANYSNKILWSYEYRHISCFVFRREVMNNLLERLCDDTGFLYSAFISGKTKYLNMMGFAYRQRSTGITHSTDNLEHDLVELLLMQDVFNSRMILSGTYAKFNHSLLGAFKKRNIIKNDNYIKYSIESAKYNNDFINLIYNYNNSDIYKKIKVINIIFKSCVEKLVYKILAIIESFLFKI